VITGRRKRRLTVILCVVVGAGIVVLALVFHAQVGSAFARLAHVKWWWALPALLAELASIGSLAHSQQYLLCAGSGKRLSLRSALASIYAGTALSISLPFIGSGVGTAYVYRHWRARGVDSAVVSWALTVSGLMSTLAFALLAAVGALTSRSVAAAVVGLAGALLSVLPVVLLLIAVRYPKARHRLARVVHGLLAVCRKLIHHPGPNADQAFEALLDRIASLRAKPKTYVAAFLMALRNWVAECTCLAWSIEAAGAPIPWHGLLLVYCIGVTAGSAGVTPGGIGIVDAALIGGLTAAGLTASHAVTAVVLYRLISLGLVVSTGVLIALHYARIDRARALASHRDGGGDGDGPADDQHASGDR
jgi:uncharacterized protein (TIRG00374 family)